MNPRIITVALLVLVGRAWGQDPVPPPPPLGSAPTQDRYNAVPSPAALAGLPEDAEAVALTLARVFALGEGRAAGQEGRDQLVEPNTLNALIKRGESLPIDRVKARFLASRDADEPNLAQAYFAALRAFSQAELSARSVARYEVTLETLRKFAKGEASDISQLQLDQVHLQLLQQRGSFFENRSRFRDTLDGLKQALKLPPGAPIVIDPAALEGFQAFALARTAWQADPNHKANGLDDLFETLPVLPEVRVGETVLKDQGDEAGLSALRNAIEADDDLEMVFQARATIRSLVRLRNQYDLDRTRSLIASRQFDSTLQQIASPPQSGRDPSRGLAVMMLNVIVSETGIARADEQLVQDWCRFQEQRLVLQRLLGTFPYNSWDELRAAYMATAPEGPPE